MYDMYYCSNMYNGGLVVCVSHNIEVSCIFLATSCGNVLLIGYCPEMYYGSYVAYNLSSRVHGALAHLITISIEYFQYHFIRRTSPDKESSTPQHKDVTN